MRARARVCVCVCVSASLCLSVTPWVWLGGGGRRLIDATHDASIDYDSQWDYDIAYSWMLGKEVNDPFYAQVWARL